MPDHERDCRPLFLRKRQELRRKLAHRVAIERHKVYVPKAEEDREQQQRVFGGSPNASACSISRRACSAAALVSGAAYPLTWHERCYERDLKLDLLATQRGRGGKVAIWSRARVSCSTASTNAERSSDRCPALPQKLAAFSISPASVQ